MDTTRFSISFLRDAHCINKPEDCLWYYQIVITYVAVMFINPTIINLLCIIALHSNLRAERYNCNMETLEFFSKNLHIQFHGYNKCIEFCLNCGISKCTTV